MTETIAPATTHVAGYLRLTRDESLAVGLSAPAQKKGIAEYAGRAQLQPLRIYEETKAVGGDVPFEKREAGSKLLAAIKRGEVKHIITRDLDRLTRDVGLALTLVEICKQYRVTIHTFTGPVPMRSASDLFAFQVRSAAAEFEKNQTGDRVRKAKRDAVEQGRWQGPPAYGYGNVSREAQLPSNEPPAPTRCAAHFMRVRMRG
jgi:DNA invertase Pin-like site-specific DNA recombinase